MLLGIAGLLDPSGGGQADGDLRVVGQTGSVFQDPESQLVMARCGDDVAFGLENHCVPTEQIWPRVDRAFAQVGFAYPREHSTSALSGGEKQRLTFAGAGVLGPDILLLDEPAANLDAEGARRVRELITQARAQGSTIVLVDHDQAAALPLVDRIIALGPLPDVSVDPARPGTTVRGAALVRTVDVAFRYPGADRWAVDGIDVEVSAGEAVALTGANGSGKSTLALLAGGLLRPARGRVTDREGRDLWRVGAADLVRMVGTVFQDPEHQFVRSRVDDELMVGPLRTGADTVSAQARVAELMERLRLAALAAANPFTLSGGEKRRLSLATALATDPPLLVLDEPTYGQDRVTYAELVRLLRDARDAGRGILFATHDRALVAALADREIALSAGRAT